jgi:hypothetical protein
MTISKNNIISMLSKTLSKYVFVVQNIVKIKRLSSKENNINGEELQFMNGEVRFIIPVRKMSKSQQAPLFLQWPSKMKATPAKETNTSANKVNVVTSR